MKFFNLKPLDYVVDGLIGEYIEGWSRTSDTVKIYIQDKIIAQTSCNLYREDLNLIMKNPKSSFKFKLNRSDISTEWLQLSSVKLKVEFYREGHVESIKEADISCQKLIDNLKISHSKNRLSSHFDGVCSGGISGWCSKAKNVEIYVGGELLSKIKCDVKREDLEGIVDDINCGFFLKLDSDLLKPHWFKKEEINLTAKFLDIEDNYIEQQTFSTRTDSFLISFKSSNGIDVEKISTTLKNSNLWDENYYLSQFSHDEEIIHKEKIKDFILKCRITGRNPHPHFNTYYYLAENPDVSKSGINPFYHYIVNGEDEGRKPVPYFNPSLYLSLNPDLKNWNGLLLHHLVVAGIYEGRIYNEFPQNNKNEDKNISYEKWQLNNEDYIFLDINKKIKNFKTTPLISIIVPVYNPKKTLLKKCIDSVINQSYQNWQLCLSDDSSTCEYVKEILEYYEGMDNRINTIYRPINGHISRASNSAISIAEGDWLALLDHDDELHQHALFEVVKVINENPSVEFIYTDEDKINEQGKRCEPHFKSDWNIDLLYSQNYVSHLGIYKKSIVNRIGGFREGYEGSQDYDLLLRYSREINHSNIVHIAKVLYHWRIVEGSTALSHGEKSYTTKAGILALDSYFKDSGKQVIVEKGKEENIYRVRWPLVDVNNKSPLVSLIIPTYNGYEITKQAISSILEKTSYENYEILLVDNNSDDPACLNYFKEVSRNEKVRVIRYPHPFNYSAINNFAVRQAKGDIIGLINNDVEVINSDWLGEMVSHAIRPEIGCVGAMLYYHNDTIQHAGVIIGLGGVAGHSHKHYPKGHNGYMNRLKVVQNLSAVTAACLLVRTDLFNLVEGLNENDLTIAFNDVDFCLKVKEAGFRNIWTPYAELYHYESISRGAEDNPVKIARFNSEVMYMKKKWKTLETPDPFYNKNLTLDKEDFSIKN